MEAAVITAVGIDVSKSKSTVAARRPGGEIVLRPFEVHHTNSDLKKLASALKKLGGDMKSGWTSFCVIGTRIVSVNIPWRLSRNLIGDGANEKTTSSVQIPLTKSICLHRRAWLLFRNAKVRRC